MNSCFRTRGVLAGLLVSLLLCASSAMSATLIPTNAFWKYLANGVDLGSSWRLPGYNDLSWPGGLAQLGYGDNDETSVIGSSNGTNSARPITTYFRRTIVIPNQVTDATLRLMRDDGAVVYVNGVEVFRDNMPTGAVNVTTLALLAIGGADESAFIETSLSPGVFVPGTNVVAVEIHQNNVLSSDMSFALALEANLGPPGPNVTVEAIAPETREQSPLVDIPLIPAVFRISRTGPTDNALGVGFSLGGTASNGVDYEFVSNSVSIPAGASNATVEIIAIDDLLVEGTESVVLTLIPTPCLECYVVGSPGSATAYILDNEPTNSPPTAWISRPQENETFTGPTNILLRAVANDAEDGYQIAVAFYATNKIGDATFLPTLCPAPDCPSWDLTWSNVTVGSYTITARATDKNGATTVSAPVHITVLPPSGGTNAFPIVRVTATDSNAMEGPSMTDTGRFTFTRTGNITSALPVYFSLSGTASNGQDYVLTSNIIVIPAGSSNAHLILTPIDDAEVEPTETVVLSVLSPPTNPGSVPYSVGDPSSAMVLIFDNDTNAPPPPPTNITLIATHSVWRYLDDGTDQGTAWRGPAFNDDTWAQGPAQLGFGDSDEATVINFGNPNTGLSFITYYFRRPFEVTGAAGISNAVVRLLRDDGGVVYLNG